MSGVAVITGGSRGIGAATALLAARDGFAVCVNYVRDAEAADAVVAEIRDTGGRAISFAGDVASEDDVVALFDTATRELGPITALVNNAGVVDMTARVDTFSRDRLMRMMTINVVGSFLAAREAIKRMSTRHGGTGGSIVNLSSAAARLGSANQYVDYAASKGAIDTMTVGLSQEVAREGIRVNAVRPGIIDTEIHASGGQPDRVARLRDTVPIGREGSATEVAETIVWLLSDKASYTTGALIDVTGGR
ncbi:MAG: SDR family oxidoreductase [Pseudomonadota bacterium]